MSGIYLDTREILAEQLPLLNENVQYSNELLKGIFAAIMVCTVLMIVQVSRDTDDPKK